MATVLVRLMWLTLSHMTVFIDPFSYVAHVSDKEQKNNTAATAAPLDDTTPIVSPQLKHHTY